MIFRGKTKGGKWVEGYLCSPNTISVLETEVYLNITNRVIYEVIPETVGMFTGLTDKNGKEIYGSIPINGEMSKGGDKIKFTEAYGYGERESIGCFTFEGGCFWFHGDGRSECEWHFYGDHCFEIIGNQYEGGEV